MSAMPVRAELRVAIVALIAVYKRMEAPPSTAVYKSQLPSAKQRWRPLPGRAKTRGSKPRGSYVDPRGSSPPAATFPTPCSFCEHACSPYCECSCHRTKGGAK